MQLRLLPLHPRAVGRAERADLAVAVRLPSQPLDAVVAVFSVARVFYGEHHVIAAGGVAPPGVLSNDDVARPNVALKPRGGFAVRRSQQQRGEPPRRVWTEHVGTKGRAVAHGRGNVDLGDDTQNSGFCRHWGDLARRWSNSVSVSRRRNLRDPASVIAGTPLTRTREEPVPHVADEPRLNST